MDLVEESVPLRGAALQVLRPRDAEALLDERAFEHEEFLPYWAELWPSGVALARRVAARALKGARVLELGCGLGLPSLAAALAGGRVLATDWSPQAIELLRDNAERNDAALELEIADWAHPEAADRARAVGPRARRRPAVRAPQRRAAARPRCRGCSANGASCGSPTPAARRPRSSSPASSAWRRTPTGG